MDSQWLQPFCHFHSLLSAFKFKCQGHCASREIQLLVAFSGNFSPCHQVYSGCYHCHRAMVLANAAPPLQCNAMLLSLHQTCLAVEAKFYQCYFCCFHCQPLCLFVFDAVVVVLLVVVVKYTLLLLLLCCVLPWCSFDCPFLLPTRLCWKGNQVIAACHLLVVICWLLFIVIDAAATAAATVIITP